MDSLEQLYLHHRHRLVAQQASSAYPVQHDARYLFEEFVGLMGGREPLLTLRPAQGTAFFLPFNPILPLSVLPSSIDSPVRR